MHSTASKALDAEINVTPMIDVLLVLPIIYMTSLGIRQAIPATLPEPAHAAIENSTQIVLELRADGSYALNDQLVPDDALEATIRGIYADRPARLLFIQAASERTYHLSSSDRRHGCGPGRRRPAHWNLVITPNAVIPPDPGRFSRRVAIQFLP